MSLSLIKLENATASINDLNCKCSDLEKAIESLSDSDAQSITELVLSKLLLMKQLPSNLSKLKNLKILRMDQCHALTDISSLKNMQLMHLFASHCYSLKTIQPATNSPLETLDISYCQSLKQEDIALITLFKETLHHLNLKGIQKLPKIAPFISLIKQLTHLQTLNIEDIPLRLASSDQIKQLEVKKVKI